VTDYTVQDVEGYDRRFAVAHVEPFDDAKHPAFLVDRETLEVYGIAGARSLHLAETVAPLHLVTGGYLWPQPKDDEEREAVLRAVELHDLPVELKEAVPFAERLTLREQLAAVLRDLAQRLRGHAERVRS
jgi:hypothetical protein